MLLTCSFIVVTIPIQWVDTHAHSHPFHILQVSLLTATLVYYFYNITHSGFAAEAAELLQAHNGQGRVDVSLLAAREQVRDGKEMNERAAERWLTNTISMSEISSYSSHFPTITNVKHGWVGCECTVNGGMKCLGGTHLVSSGDG